MASNPPHGQAAENFRDAAYTAGLLIAFVGLSLIIYDQYHWAAYRLAHVLALRLGYFKDQYGKRMKYLDFNTRVLRFSHGHEISKKGLAISEVEPFITWNDGKPEIVLSRPDHIRQFYGRDTKGHAKPPHMGMGPFFERVLGSSVGVLNGDKWKTMRKVFDPNLSHGIAMDFRTRFGREVEAWMESLPAVSTKQGDGADGPGLVVDASTACKTLPFKLVALILYNEALSDAAFEELLELNNLHEKVMFKTFFGGPERSRLLSHLPTQSNGQMDEFGQKWRAFNLKMIKTAEEKHQSCPVADMYPSVVNGSITELEFLHTIDEILFANIDVTSSVLAFLLVNLARNSSAQRHLRAEILANATSPEAYVQKTDTLLEHTCMESIRLCPAAWFSLPECATSDMTIDGYRIPAGTPCIIDWWRLNTQSPVWQQGGYSGTSFRPERFRSLSPQDYRWSFLRFGLGSRKCIGKNVSGVLMKTFLVGVLQKFDLQSVGPTSEEEMSETRKDRFTVTPDKRVRLLSL